MNSGSRRARLLRPFARRGADRVIYVVLFVVIFGVVMHPVSTMIVNSFVDGYSAADRHWSIEGWRRALNEPSIAAAIWNTIKVVLVVEAISLPFAIMIAWLLARSDVPFAGGFEFIFWIAFFVPVLSATLGWIVLLDPQTGLINQLFRSVFGIAPFDIYTFWGIVWTHVATNAVAVKVMLLAPIFRNLDSSHEEASRISGGGQFYTLRRVVLPLASPGIATVFVLATIRGLQTFEIEQVLGAPTNFWVFGNLIYRLIEHQPPEFGPAMVLSSLVMVLIVPLIIFHRWIIGRNEYGTVSGRMKIEPMKLGLLRWPVFMLLSLTIIVLVALPVCSLAMSTFMKLFGFFNIPEPWTMQNWKKVIEDDFFMQAVANTVKIAGTSALLSMTLSMLLAYFIVRTDFPGRGILDFATWLPFALPGILFGVAILYGVLSTPVLKGLYGSIWVLILGVFVVHMTLGVQIMKATMVQLTPALEESARTSGASWFATLRRIVIPLCAPTMILVGVMSFVSAARDISTIALLGNNETKPLSLLQLDYLVDGRSESAAVVSTILVLLTVGLALLARAALKRPL